MLDLNINVKKTNSSCVIHHQAGESTLELFFLDLPVENFFFIFCYFYNQVYFSSRQHTRTRTHNNNDRELYTKFSLLDQNIFIKNL